MYLDLAIYIYKLQEPVRLYVIIGMIIFLLVVMFIYDISDTNQEKKW